MKATVVYYSHKGKTAGYAREIAMYLWSKGWNVSLSSLSDFKPERILDLRLVCCGAASAPHVGGSEPTACRHCPRRADAVFHHLQDSYGKHVPKDEEGDADSPRKSLSGTEIKNRTTDREGQTDSGSIY